MTFLKKLLIFGLLIILPSTGYCAIKAAVSSGTFSTMTWYTVRNTPTIHASTNVTVSSSANTTLSATFKANSTSDTNYGVFVYIGAVGSAGAVTFNLQEYDGVSAWTTRASQTRTISQLTASQWQWVNWSTPYTYTTTTAGYYRINAQISGATGTTSLAADSGGSLFAYVTPDNASAGTPGTGDDIWIGGTSGTPTVVTLDGTQTVGSRAYTGAPSNRSVGNAITQADYGNITYDTVANVALTVRGSWVVCTNATLTIGTSGAAYPQTATTTWSCNASLDHGFLANSNATISIYGASVSYYKTTYSSGAGTTGSPLVMTDDVNWVANDMIALSGNAYNNYVIKYIKTKNVGTPDTYILSDSPGGAESGITAANFTTAVDWVLNLQHNIIFTSDNTSKGYYFNVVASDTSNIVSTQFLYSSVSSTGFASNVDTVSFYNSIGTSTTITYFYGSTTTQTVQNIIGVISPSSTSTAASFTFGSGASGIAKNIVATNCYFLGGYRGQLTFTVAGCTFTNVNLRNSNQNANWSIGTTPWQINQSTNSTFTNCTTDAIRYRDVSFNGNLVKTTFTNCAFGKNVAPSVANLAMLANIYVDILLSNCSVSTPFFDSSNTYTGLLTGSKILFNTYDETLNSNYAYNPQGYITSTGYLLTDTTVWTGTAFAAASSGQFGLVMYPESSTIPLIYEDNKGSSLVGNCQNLTLTVTARFKIDNAAYYAGTKTLPTLRVTYDDGATVVTDVADASTDAQQLQVVFTPTTSTPFIKIEILGATDAASPNNKFYLGELIVAGPSGVIIDTTRFSGTVAAWSNGLPLGTFRTFLAPANMWDEPSSIHNITDSFGELIVRIKNVLKRVEAMVGAGV